MQFIDLKTQYAKIYEDVNKRIANVLDHGQYILGPEIKEMEEKLAEYTGSKHCISAASGTDALLISLMVLNIKADEEVITTPFSFIATAEVIALLGAKPVFVDIDKQTYNIDYTKIEEKINSKTKAIMPVSLYGQCADFDEINEIANKYNLPVIEDACQSFGAVYKEKKSNALSTIGCTSFFPSKPLGCYGDGGAIFTNDDALAEKMRHIRVHGQDKRYNHPILGINGRFDSIQAAVILSKLELFKEEVILREKIGKRYSEKLQDSVITPFVKEHNTHVYAQYTIQVENRNKFAAKLNEKNIPTAVHYPIPLHLQPVFSYLNEGAGSYPEAEALSQKVISLPMHPYLSEEDQDKIINAVKDAVI
ncbi:MAG: DegT/DnrJ/EryC1/StrS family aminotransferase [Spirochaetia bacterium]|nr:DegT/DnrJ/EryC1/StrS family aminotransferase [Spirochaetia bacterium]